MHVHVHVAVENSIALHYSIALTQLHYSTPLHWLSTHTHTHRAKHPVKVHVWAGISKRGRTGICIFEGTLVKELYVDILDQTLLPFIRDVFPDGHRFMQDNDPKHVSKLAKEFLRTNGVNWWTTPPESPDANPIENLWHELKEFIRRKSSHITSKNWLLG